MERKKKTLPSHRLGRERCHDGGESLSRARKIECVTPTCHTHGVPQEEGGQSTVGTRKSRRFSVEKEAVGGGGGRRRGGGGGGDVGWAGLRGRGVVEVSG